MAHAGAPLWMPVPALPTSKENSRGLIAMRAGSAIPQPNGNARSGRKRQKRRQAGIDSRDHNPEQCCPDSPHPPTPAQLNPAHPVRPPDGPWLHCMTKRKEQGDLAALYGVNRGTHTQLIAYQTIEAWGTGSDDVGFIQSTKAPNHQTPVKVGVNIERSSVRSHALSALYAL